MGLLNQDIKDVGMKYFSDAFKRVFDTADKIDYQGNNPGAELIIHNMLRIGHARAKILDLPVDNTQEAFEKMILQYVQSTLDNSIKQMNYCGITDPSKVVNKDEMTKQITESLTSISINVDIQTINNTLRGICVISIDGSTFKQFYFT